LHTSSNADAASGTLHLRPLWELFAFYSLHCRLVTLTHGRTGYGYAYADANSPAIALTSNVSPLLPRSQRRVPFSHATCGVRSLSPLSPFSGWTPT
jgi:hypothetical protein